jgi:hypothetical protein
VSTMHHKKVGSAIASALLATTASAVAVLATPSLTAPAAAAPVAQSPATAVRAAAVDPIETMPLWRVQVRITTGTVPDAATKGHPAIRFNPTTTGVRTLNPQSPTAFSRGREVTHDVRLFNDASQITMLRLGIAGADNWCVQKVQLVLNDRIAFSWVVSGGTCARIEQGARNLDFSFADLRNNPAWKAYGQPPALPRRMSLADLRARIASVTGSAILTMPRVSWDLLTPVRVFRKTSTTVGVTYALMARDRFPFTARKVPITFDVRFSVGFFDGKLHSEMRNPVPTDYAGRASGPAVADLNTALTRMTTVPLPHPPLSFGVDAGANLSWRFVPVVG